MSSVRTEELNKPSKRLKKKEINLRLLNPAVRPDGMDKVGRKSQL